MLKIYQKKQINEIDKKLKLSSDAPDGVNIKIPRFKFSYNLRLKQDSKKLGIKEAFSKDNANFSKMAYVGEMDRSLYITDALHSADINFNEDGIKTAAVKLKEKVFSYKINDNKSSSTINNSDNKKYNNKKIKKKIQLI